MLVTEKTKTKEIDVISMKKKLGIQDLVVDEHAKKILNYTIEDIEKWHPDDIGNASIVMTRHALIVKLELNRLMALIEHYKSEISKAQKLGLDDLEVESKSRLTSVIIKRNTLFNIPEHILEFSSAIKKMFDKQVDKNEK